MKQTGEQSPLMICSERRRVGASGGASVSVYSRRQAGQTRPIRRLLLYHKHCRREMERWEKQRSEVG